MSLVEKKCVPCEGGVAPLEQDRLEQLLEQVSDWNISEDGKSICKEYSFRNYYRTMGFVNAVAWMANGEGHHPDLAVSYNKCVITYTTHAIDGLTENDFICAAKADELLQYGPN